MWHNFTQAQANVYDYLNYFTYLNVLLDKQSEGKQKTIKHIGKHCQNFSDSSNGPYQNLCQVVKHCYACVALR